MSKGVRVILFNADEEYQITLRAALLEIDGVKIVAEVNEAALLPNALDQYTCDLVLVHLDPVPEVALDLAIQAAGLNPNRPVFALSECTDGPLILSAMRGGIREFLTKPLDQRQLTDAVGRVMEIAQARKSQGKLFSFVGSIGGVGVSTLSTNLAVELAGAGPRSVALVDLDFRFGQIGTMLDLQPKHTIADLCDTPEMLEPALIEKVMIPHDSGVHVLARPATFEQADSITAAHCASVLSALQDQYDYVIVDGPNRFDSGGVAVLNVSDLTFLVMQLTVPSVRNVHRMLGSLKAGGFNMDRLQLLCNRNASRDLGGLDLRDVEKTLGREIFWTIPGDWKSVGESMNLGQPLLVGHSKTKVRQAIREFAEKLLSARDGQIEQPSSDKKGGGLLSKIFSHG